MIIIAILSVGGLADGETVIMIVVSVDITVESEMSADLLGLRLRVVA